MASAPFFLNSFPYASQGVEMPNPFDDESRLFKVLVNAEQQHSLWPSGIDVPQGWTTVLDDAPRERCLAHVEAHWTDLRPGSLRDLS